MIAVVDYGLGNLRSVIGALEFLGAAAMTTRDSKDLFEADKLVLPGVGSFTAAMDHIDRRDLRGPIIECVRERKKPILGICLGMQLLASSGDEEGPTPGLGLIPAEVKLFPDVAPPAGPLRVPHIGFNTTTIVAQQGKRSPLYAGLGERAEFYFIHSYRMVCTDDADVSGWCEYGGRFAASVERGHIYGAQFHPEKSQTNGLRLLQNFVRLDAPC